MASIRTSVNLDLSSEKSEINLDPSAQTNTIELAEPPQVVQDALKQLKFGGKQSNRSLQLRLDKDQNFQRQLPLKNQILQKLRDGLPPLDVNI